MDFNQSEQRAIQAVLGFNQDSFFKEGLQID
jgi:hypothetical protein